MADVTKRIIIPVEVKGEQEAERELKRVTKATEDATDASEDHAEATDEQGESLVDVAKNAKIFGISINSLTAGFKRSTTAIKTSIKSLKLFKVALAATGIGLAVIAVAAFTAALRTSKAVQDEFSDAGAFLTGVVDRMIGSFGRLFETLTRSEDGQNRFIKFLKLAVRGISLFLPAISLLTEQLFAAGDAAAAANKETREFNEGIAQQTLEINKVALQIERLVADTRELGVTGAQQFNLITEALGLFIDKQALSIELLDQEEAALLAKLNAQEEATRDQFEAEQALIEFQTKRLNTERQLSAQRRELLNRQTESSRRAALERVKIAQDTSEEIIETFKDETDALIAELSKQLLAQAAFGAQFEKFSNVQAEAELERAAANAGANEEIAKSNQKLQALTLSQALGNITISLSEALAKVFGQTGVGGFIIAPLILAAFAGITNRLTTLITSAIPTFSEGGYIGGNLHSQGGTVIEAERGEYMINRKSMLNPKVAEIAQALNNFGQSKGLRFQEGGFVPVSNVVSFADITNILERLPRSVLVTEDLDRVQRRVQVTEDRATL